MKIHEYQAAELFRRYGVRVPEGKDAATAQEAGQAAAACALIGIRDRPERSQIPLTLRAVRQSGAERGQRERCEQEQVMSDCFHYSMRLISSSKATACCSPVAMFLSAQTCCATSSSPRKITNGMPSLSA